MKLLINLCAQDGIVSHNSGVGTMVKRYIYTFEKILNENCISYHINLFTPKYKRKGYGFSKNTLEENKKSKNISIYELSNGTGGKKFFGNRRNWELLSKNAAKIINSIDYSNYDFVLSLANDTPFAGILNLTTNSTNHIKIWIPHSTAKIHQIEENTKITEEINTRIEWETNAINYINSTPNAYLGVVGKYIKRHLINEYSLINKKVINLYNGEVLSQIPTYSEELESIRLFEKMNKKGDILLAFGRPEKYKNLDGAMKLASKLNIRSVVITQEYFEGMPYVNYLKELSKETKTELFLNKPFHLPQYIIKNYPNNIILVVPSKKEIAGLVVNEIRRFNKDNILLVANNIDGINEQVDDGIDGILVNLDDLDNSCIKIKKYFNTNSIRQINLNSQKRLSKDYNFEKTCKKFLKKITGRVYE